MAASSGHQTKDGKTGDCWQGTVADRGDSSSGLDGGRGRGAFAEIRGREQGGGGPASSGSIGRGAASVASGCSEGGSQCEPALSVADLEPLDRKVHVNCVSKFWVSPCGYTYASVAGRGRTSCSTERVPAGGAGGGGTGGGSSRGTNGTSCCRIAAEPVQPITITVCAGRWGGGCGGGSGGGAGLSGERPGSELAEWRSQGSELAEWRSQARELAESAAGCRTAAAGCRTVSAQAVHISTYWELWVSPERGCSPVEARLCIVSLVSDSQCSLLLCLSRRLLQRTSQGAGGAMGQWVVERWPTMHSNNASKMGAARNWVLRGHYQADPTGFLRELGAQGALPGGPNWVSVWINSLQ